MLPDHSTAAPSLCLANVTLLASLEQDPLVHAMLCMENTLVHHAASVKDTLPFPLENCLSLPGRTVLPGLVNAHMHSAWNPETRRRQYLTQGVTTLCDLAAPFGSVPLLRRQRTDTGEPTPRTLTAGPALTAPGGYPLQRHGSQWCMEVETAAQAAQTVRLLHAWGARILKLLFEPGSPEAPLPLLGVSPARAAAHVARELGMPVRAHISEARGLALALDVGVDAVEHLPLRSYSGSSACSLRNGQLSLAPEIDDLFQQMRDCGVALTPTLDALSRSVWDNAPLLELVRRFHQLGGVVALGTDAPFAGVQTGAPLGELELLHQAGLTRQECLLAATRHAALVSGVSQTGVLLPGFAADAVVVRGNPLTDFSVLSDPEYVILGGKIVFQRSKDVI